MDFDIQIVGQIDHPAKSFRLYAIEKIIENGVSEKDFSNIEKRLKVEDDPECRSLLEHAVAVFKSKTAAGNRPPKFDPKEFCAEFSKFSVEKKLSAIADLPLPRKNDLLEYIPSLIENESDPLAATVLIKSFGSILPEEKLKCVGKKLLSKNLGLRLAALDILVQRVPKTLAEILPRFLIAEDPRIRSLAIKGLGRIDPDEALNHNLELMRNDSEFHKSAALENCFQFPFDRLKPFLLEFLLKENNPDLVRQAGVFFAINPDPEIPFRLLEIIEKSSVEKAQILNQILERATQALFFAGELEEGLENFKNRLKEFSAKRKIIRFVNECIDQLSSTEENLTEIEETLSLIHI